MPFRKKNISQINLAKRDTKLLGHKCFYLTHLSYEAIVCMICKQCRMVTARWDVCTYRYCLIPRSPQSPEMGDNNIKCHFLCNNLGVRNITLSKL